ncbi:TetR family transcriptional regulator [Acinetobacter sp. ANC 4558]|uniref:TetR family transcriptional regulator n=1 Tax=Acinetobacter sp. ANC 4558 TaxID=1977876 RepID=UPI000A344FC2|nr:TetR family transcriptional regulator [Acinetobacter sp. ANC 4558]OTG88249.1 TetR family transcriptional regulator [Acinetobacter sp. ANC 4558]
MSVREERKQQSRQAIINAALLLSTSGRSFTNISLREITRMVGVVPAAFYRHFENMDALALEIIDQVSLHFKSLSYYLGQTYSYLPEAKIEHCLELVLNSIDQNPQQWMFLITERWGGSNILREAISREINFLTQDLATDLKKVEAFRHTPQQQKLCVLAQTLINLSFNWAMTWLSYRQQLSGEQLKQQQKCFKEQTILQIQLLFHGITYWRSEKSTES